MTPVQCRWQKYEGDRLQRNTSIRIKVHNKPVVSPSQLLRSKFLIDVLVRGAITRYHKLGGLNNRNLLFHSPGSLRSRCQQGWFLLRAVRKNYASHLASGVLLAIFGVPWFIDISPRSLPLCSHGILPVWVSVFKIPLFIRTQVILD